MARPEPERKFRFWPKPPAAAVVKAEVAHPGRGPKPVSIVKPLGQIMAWFTDGSLRHVDGGRPRGKANVKRWKRERQRARLVKPKTEASPQGEQR